jgi:hypothetical protein
VDRVGDARPRPRAYRANLRLAECSRLRSVILGTPHTDPYQASGNKHPVHAGTSSHFDRTVLHMNRLRQTKPSFSLSFCFLQSPPPVLLSAVRIVHWTRLGRGVWAVSIDDQCMWECARGEMKQQALEAVCVNCSVWR